MNILRNGFIYDSVRHINICSVENEEMTQNLSASQIDAVIKAYESNIVVPCFRLYLLYEDETPNIDISEDLISGNLSVTYQTGQRRTLNVSLINEDNKYKPDPINGLIWTGTKFRLDIGIFYEGTIYWKQQGIFVLKDPSRSRDGASTTISLSLADKFGLFDGSVYGKSSLKTIIPVNIPIRQAFYTLIGTDRGNGVAYDLKEIHFDRRYYHEKTPYTIKQEAGRNMGDILIELGQGIACDVYYNEYGNLCIQSNQLDFINNNFVVAYRINETNRGVSFSISENWSKMRNKIVVKGNIVNGYQFSAVVENRNLVSPYCIQYNGEIPENIQDNALYSDTLCMDRGMYEMVNYSRGVRSLNISCPLMPLLDVNQSILVTSDYYGFYNNNFVIDNFSIDMSSDPKMSIVLTNINEVNFS